MKRKSKPFKNNRLLEKFTEAIKKKFPKIFTHVTAPDITDDL